MAKQRQPKQQLADMQRGLPEAARRAGAFEQDRVSARETYLIVLKTMATTQAWSV
ncbi:MAG TPA: hypothetical protein VHZ09_06410 [Acidobacteriaceae bacterium]|jgi:hypothetical protein|nr:hypothetical protein [Acidobacteriaceae bacterium]